MDEDVRDALLTLHAALAIMARRQTEQGEMLAGIIKLLTPDKDEERGPSLEASVERMTAAIRSSTAVQVAAIRELASLVHGLPAETARAMSDGTAAPPKAGR